MTLVFVLSHLVVVTYCLSPYLSCSAPFENILTASEQDLWFALLCGLFRGILAVWGILRHGGVDIVIYCCSVWYSVEAKVRFVVSLKRSLQVRILEYRGCAHS